MRTKGGFGSSKAYSECLGEGPYKSYLSTLPTQQSVLHKYNTVIVKYCDGGSFAGDADRQYNVRIDLISLFPPNSSTVGNHAVLPRAS